MIRRSKARKFYMTVARVLGSVDFTRFIVAVIIFQGLWFALTYQPGLFDELFHFEFIRQYSTQFSPFLSGQTTDWDYLGAAARNPNYVFYYMMSWPYRIIDFFTNSLFVQVVALRMIFLAATVGGFFAYRNLLMRIGASKALANLTMLIVFLTPVVATFVSVISYDLVIFALFPVVTLLLLDVIGSSRLGIGKAWGVLTISLFASLMKFSFIPLMVAIFAILAFELWKRGDEVLPQTKRWFGGLNHALKVFAILVPVLLAIMVLERPVQNTLVYGKPTPPCTDILPEARCKNNPSASRDISFSRRKPSDFSPLDPARYTFQFWIIGIIRSQSRLMPAKPILPVVGWFLLVATLVGGSIILGFSWQFIKDKYVGPVFVISLVYVAALFFQQYISYVRLGGPAAISARYLLPVAPVFVYLVILGIKMIAGKRFKPILATGTLAILLILSQGGGITTHILTVNQWKWEDGLMTETINPQLKDAARVLVIEEGPSP